MENLRMGESCRWTFRETRLDTEQRIRLTTGYVWFSALSYETMAAWILEKLDQAGRRTQRGGLHAAGQLPTAWNQSV